MRPYERINTGKKKDRKNLPNASTRDAPPRIVVNGETLNLTPDTGLKRVENTAAARSPADSS